VLAKSLRPSERAHPNIAAIYGLEDKAIVMELVEGQMLAERIAAGPLSLDEALGIAKQIAEALEVAHDDSVERQATRKASICDNRGHECTTMFVVFECDGFVLWSGCCSASRRRAARSGIRPAAAGAAEVERGQTG